MAMDISRLTLKDALSLMDSGNVTSQQIVRSALERIEQNKLLNNYITVCGESALENAWHADKRRKNGERLPLLGVPIAVKDNISTKDIQTTCASKILEGYIPPYDATVVERLKNAGAVVIGKTNMDEFAMGCTNENSAYGASRNVNDTMRVPGGSSGGSANTVAAGEVCFALGSDTGGSVRQPSAYCGVVGLKPTYSAVSRYGLIAFASSLDQVGLVANDCDDCYEFYKIICGRDDRDSTTAVVTDLPSTLDSSVDGKVIGVAEEFLHGSDECVREAFSIVIDALRASGAIIKRVSIKSFSAALSTYSIISSAEAATNLARFDGVRYGKRASDCSNINDVCVKTRTQYLGAEVKRRLMLGNYVLTGERYEDYYLRAKQVRTAIANDYQTALSQCDVLISPTAPTIAPLINSSGGKKRYSDMYAAPVSLADLPAVSVPFGKHKGMPIGMQVIGKKFSEPQILGIGKAIEKLSYGSDNNA